MSNKNKNSAFLPVLVVSLLVIIIAAILVTFFEIEQYKQKGDMSKEARHNKYLALDRWLIKTGHPLTILEAGGIEDIKDIKESEANNIIIFGSAFNDDELVDLKDFIFNGYNVTFFLDFYYDAADSNDKYFKDLLDNYYIDCSIGNNSAYDTEPKEKLYDFDLTFEFKISDTEKLQKDFPGIEYTLVKDEYDVTRLIILKRNGCTFSICDWPFFMQSENLGKLHNAELAWSITGELDPKHKGFLIFRRTDNSYEVSYEEGLLAKIMQNKTGIFLVLSSIALVAVGLWMNIAGFGRLIPQRAQAGKSINERFITEGRFLKKYAALSLYVESLVSDIRAHYKRRGIENDAGIIQNAQKEFNISEDVIINMFNAEGKIKIRDLVQYKKITTIILGEKHGY
jgi:hypothetical protein